MIGVRMKSGVVLLLLCVSCGCPDRRTTPGPKAGSGQPTDGGPVAAVTWNADEDDRQAMRYLSCARDGRGYVFALAGRFDVQVVARSPTTDLSYSVCVGAPGAEPACHPATDRRWQLEVDKGDVVTARVSASGSLLDARLCPSDARSPFAEWSVEEEALAIDRPRMLPVVGIVVQEIGAAATSPPPTSGTVLWVDQQLALMNADRANDESRAMRFLTCAASGQGYVFTMSGRFDLLATGTASRLESPYSICIGMPRQASVCHAIAAGTRWEVRVRAGEEVTVRSSTPEVPLDARLCPSDERSPFAEWSQAPESLRVTDRRPPPYLGVVAQLIEQE